MVKVNGQEKSIGSCTILQYLCKNGYDIKRIAVELNGEIVPKAQYDSVILNDGDCIEIVSFVGGG